jgi:hypothetical protein
LNFVVRFALAAMTAGWMAGCRADKAPSPVSVEAEPIQEAFRAPRVEDAPLFGPAANAVGRLSSVAQYLPADAPLIASVSLQSKKLLGVSLFLPEGSTRELMRQLQSILERFTGIDKLDLREAVVVGSMSGGTGYAVLVGASGSKPLRGETTRFGTLDAIEFAPQVYLARLGKNLVLGDPPHGPPRVGGRRPHRWDVLFGG